MILFHPRALYSLVSFCLQPTEWNMLTAFLSPRLLMLYSHDEELAVSHSQLHILKKGKLIGISWVRWPLLVQSIQGWHKHPQFLWRTLTNIAWYMWFFGVLFLFSFCSFPLQLNTKVNYHNYNRYPNWGQFFLAFNMPDDFHVCLNRIKCEPFILDHQDEHFHFPLYICFMK